MINKAGTAVNFSELVDELDELLASTFGLKAIRAVADDPSKTYLLLAYLLHGLCDDTPGFEATEAFTELDGYFTDVDSLDKVRSCAATVRDRFAKITKPNYVAASFWSPLDKQRRTIFGRSKATVEETRKVLMNACAFYALSLAGPPRYYTTIQYAAAAAPRKRGPRVSYDKTPPDNLGWWHIPEGSHEVILNDSGLLTAIDAAFGDLSSVELSRLLRLTLHNRDRDRWEDHRGFAQGYLSRFDECFRRASELTRQVTEEALRYVTELFAPESPISEEQVLFMVVTNLLWQRVCPTRQFYAFLVHVENTCSVMTIGTDEPLDQVAKLTLSRFARSVLTYPLFLNFASKRADEERIQERDKVWRNLLQRVRHQIATPHMTMMANFDILRVPERVGDAPRILSKIERSAQEIGRIVHDMTRYLDDTPIVPSVLAIKPILAEVEVMARDHDFEFMLDCPEELFILANHSLLRTCFHELTVNSSRWCECSPKSIVIRASRAEPSSVPLHLPQPRDYALITFADNGPGVRESVKHVLFEPGVSEHEKGTGIGLSIVRRNISRHDGWICLMDRREMVGAAFGIYLPLVESNASTESHSCMEHLK